MCSAAFLIVFAVICLKMIGCGRAGTDGSVESTEGFAISASCVTGRVCGCFSLRTSKTMRSPMGSLARRTLPLLLVRSLVAPDTSPWNI